jgi:hypothetical protein
MGYEPGVLRKELSDDETERAGLPPDPRWIALLQEQHYLPTDHYDKYLARDDLDADLRELWTVERDISRAFEESCLTWATHYELATEYPKSKIFVALKEARLTAMGRRLPAVDVDVDQALADLKAADQYILDLPVTEVPPSFWTLQGLNFEISAADNGVVHYCHLSLSTEEVLKLFPGERQAVVGVERVGETLILGDGLRPSQASIRRGRPPYPWDAFHLELAELLRREQVPTKKEAAIEYFQSWFEREHGVRPSRAAVGDKLKPYFDKFIKSSRQKI